MCPGNCHRLRPLHPCEPWKIEYNCSLNKMTIIICQNKRYGLVLCNAQPVLSFSVRHREYMYMSTRRYGFVLSSERERFWAEHGKKNFILPINQYMYHFVHYITIKISTILFPKIIGNSPLSRQSPRRHFFSPTHTETGLFILIS